PSSSCSGASCTVDSGSAATLMAPTVPGYRLIGWSGAGCDAGVPSGSGLTLTPSSGHLTCTAMYALGVSVSGTGRGAVVTIDASSTSAGAMCSPGVCTIDQGGSVTLKAPDAAGFRFDAWTGDAGCSGTSQTLVLGNVQSSVSCTANYVQRVTVAGAMSGGLAGTVTVTPADPKASCANGSTCTVDIGTSVTVTAPSVANHRFTGFAGGCGATSPAMVTANGDLA